MPVRCCLGHSAPHNFTYSWNPSVCSVSKRSRNLHAPRTTCNRSVSSSEGGSSIVLSKSRICFMDKCRVSSSEVVRLSLFRICEAFEFLLTY
jgi:hypothetical protein